VYVYYGPDRVRSPDALAAHDVVITTYSVLAQDLGRSRGGLLAVDWLRVVLDEGHTIRNVRTTQLGRAALALKAERRWIVTGTPIQNRSADLYAAAAFLRLEPLR
jgi:SWI/SNF-related matrix-associated actin-dependent regulator of chromatin subfamily A3